MTDHETVLEPTGGPRAGNRALSVMDQIREAVLNGSVAAGERLNEVRLSRTLAVSRTPVRAALQALAGEGLLDYAPNRGFTVRDFPLDAIVDAYEIRASLEGRCGAVCRGTRPQSGRKGDDRAQPPRRRQIAGARLVRNRRSHDLSRSSMVTSTTLCSPPRATGCSPR